MSYNKYGAKAVTLDNIRFDSMAEAHRYEALKILHQQGEITHLEIHPRYQLQGAFRRDGQTYRAIYYEADFAYYERGRAIVEDVKGKPTAVFLIKKKLFLHRYREIELRIITA